MSSTGEGREGQGLTFWAVVSPVGRSRTSVSGAVGHCFSPLQGALLCHWICENTFNYLWKDIKFKQEYHSFSLFFLNLKICHISVCVQECYRTHTQPRNANHYCTRGGSWKHQETNRGGEKGSQISSICCPVKIDYISRLCKWGTRWASKLVPQCSNRVSTVSVYENETYRFNSPVFVL